MENKSRYEEKLDREVAKSFKDLEKISEYFNRVEALEKKKKLKVLDILLKHFYIKYERPYDVNLYSYILESKDTEATFHIHLNPREHKLFKSFLDEYPEIAYKYSVDYMNEFDNTKYHLEREKNPRRKGQLKQRLERLKKGWKKAFKKELKENKNG